MNDVIYPAEQVSNAGLETNQATVVLPAGYDGNVIIVKNDTPEVAMPEPLKAPVDAALDMIDDFSDDAGSKLKFMRKVYLVVTCTLRITQ